MRVQIDSTNTFYQKIGTGPTIVLLHGWGCDWQIWSPLIPELSKTHQLLIPDLPGFGKSETEIIDQWNTPKYVQWFEKFINATISSEKFILVGHSLGGKIASCVAAESSLKKRIQKLILIDSSGIPFELPLARKLQKQLLGLIPSVIKNAIPTTVRTRLLEATHSSTDHYYASSTHKKLLQALIAEDIRPQLRSITAPTFIFWGNHDSDTPVVQAHEFQTLITGSKLFLLNTGHFPFIEQPVQFSERLKEVV